MDSLKAKKEERVSKEDAFLALTNKAKSTTLSLDEVSQMDTLEAEIAAIDKAIDTLERAEKKAAEIVKRQSAQSAVGAPQDNQSETKELTGIANTFLVSKAISNVIEQKQHDGVEKEVYAIAKEEAKEAGVELSGRGIAIPGKFIQIGKRKALTVGTESADVVFTEYGGRLIPYLNPVPVADSLGVTFLQGLRGNVQFPRVSGDVAFSWETETSNVDETTPTFDNVGLAPKRVGGYVDVTLQMLKQGVFAVEPYLRNALNNRYALTIDHTVFNGTGSGNQPTGIFYYSGVNTLSLGSSGGDMTYAALISMIRDAKAGNARMGREAFITNSYGSHALSITSKQASGVEGNFIYSGSGPLVGVPLTVSNTIPSNFSEGSMSDGCGIIYSTNWGGALFGAWGGLELVVDPYTQALAGTVRFVCNAFMDFDIEQPVEFSICKDWDATDLPALT